MRKLVAVVNLLLLCHGVDNFKLSVKDYENFEKMVELGAQVFLNCLDKVRDVTEKIVKENQLRTNRIAIQGHWNSFKETANRISTEERNKGEQDDVVVVARTIRRLILSYKDSIQWMIHSLATEKDLQQYLPVMNMLEGVIQREKLNDVWGSVESNYFPGAPSIKTEPLEFLCYLLSTSTMETIMVNIFKTVMDVTSFIRNIDFQQFKKSLESVANAILKKFEEFEDLEKGQEKDEIIVSVSAATRVFIFYWDQFLEYTESPDFQQKFNHSEAVLAEKNYGEKQEISEIISKAYRCELLTDALTLHFEYFFDFYIVAYGIIETPLRLIGRERRYKTNKALEKVAVIAFAPIWEKLWEMEVFPATKRLYYRAVNISSALVEEEDFQTFRGIIMEKWRPFKEEAFRVLREERVNAKVIIIPTLRASLRLFSNYSSQLINEYVDDAEAEQLAKKLEEMRKICTETLLAKGIITQKQLEEAQSEFVEGFFKFLNMAGEQRMHDSLWTLYKASLVFLNFIYSPLAEAWNFISV
ncbi:uncharacterized protein [Hoplias malabaricus]|uniref:uncharacterized protein n=1 Tax=Hoplias malabaricus TaxID=27720 RepID=UPI00346206F7